MARKLEFGDVSPLAGMVTGKGLMGELMQKGFGGLIPMQLARSAAEEEEEKRKRDGVGMPPIGAPGMKKGGKVKAKAKSSASKRGDGIAQRGKTKGRFV